MIFPITIEVLDADLEDITQAIVDKYGYSRVADSTEDGITTEVENPQNAIDFMKEAIVRDLRGRVSKMRKDAIAKAAIEAIDETTIASNITIS